MKTRSLFAIAVLLGTIGLAECGLRLVLGAGPSLTHPAPAPLHYELKAGASLDPTRWPQSWGAKLFPFPAYRISTQGIRGDREYAVPKPLGTKRIVVLGDSYTFGWEVEIQESYPAQLESLLHERGFPNWEVVNLGVPGYNAEQWAASYERHGKRFDPDFVIAAFVENDLHEAVRYPAPALLPFFKGFFLLYMTFHYIYPPDRSTGEYERYHFPERMLTTIENLSNELAAQQIPWRLVFLDKWPEEDRRKRFLEVCNSRGFPVIDLSDLSTQPDARIGGIGHFTSIGNQRIAEALLDSTKSEPQQSYSSSATPSRAPPR